MKKILLILIILLIETPSTAETISLGGDQKGEYPSGRYVVTKTIRVPAGDTMTIDSGSTLLFNPYTGIEINGCLKFTGTAKNSIKLTAKSSDSTETFIQWNGLLVPPGGSLLMKNVSISNAVFGIKSDAKNSINLENILFKNNSEDFQIGDSVAVILENESYSGKFNIKVPQQVPASKLTSNSIENVVVSNKSKKKKWKLPVRLSLGVVAVAGGVVSAVSHIQYNDFKDNYSSDGKKSDRESANSALHRRNIFGSIAVGAITGLVITIPF